MNLRLAADRVNPKKAYAYDAYTGKVFRSVDAGASFTASNDKRSIALTVAANVA